MIPTATKSSSKMMTNIHHSHFIIMIKKIKNLSDKNLSNNFHFHLMYNNILIPSKKYNLNLSWNYLTLFNK